jgi:hypothetical protein
MKRLPNGVKNILLWSYERGSWQYDLLCLLIVAAILLLPGRYFGDRDRPLRRALASHAAGQAAETLPNQETFKSAPETADLRHWDVEVGKLNAFTSRIGQPDALKQNPAALLELYLREMVRVDVALEHYEPQLNRRGDVTHYRVWFK